MDFGWTPGREGIAKVMDGHTQDGRLRRAGYRALLVAMAIQGLTPDSGDLASSWLLRLVASGPADAPAEDGAPAPIHRGDQHDLPGAIGPAIAAKSLPRGRLDDGGRIGLHFLSASPLARPGRSAPRSLDPPGVVPPESDERLSSLCRFRC